MADITCCGQYYEVGDELVGHSFTCPKCGSQTVFRKTFSGSYSAPSPAPAQRVTGKGPGSPVGRFQAWHVRKLNELGDWPRMKRRRQGQLGAGLMLGALAVVFSEQYNLGTPESNGGALLTMAFFGSGLWLMVSWSRDRNRQRGLENRFCRFCGAGHSAEARYCVACGKETR
jgi:predicted RNA-binding Zn-ribbon protein involved in translation (DUF1610 family)